MTDNISERIDNAIKDIEKIQIMFRQRYGEECLADKEIQGVLKIAKSEHEELEKYRSIGTVEECREATEKQIPKIPYTYGDGYADGYPVIDMYECPNCGETYEIECDHYEYCPKCGQRMDRSELDLI